METSSQAAEFGLKAERCPPCAAGFSDDDGLSGLWSLKEDTMGATSMVFESDRRGEVFAAKVTSVFQPVDADHVAAVA